MKYQKQCECCGHLTTAYAHKLNKQLIRALGQLVKFYEANKKPANLQKNLDLTKNQYNNFHKLQYFGLVQHTKDGWYPTEQATRFIYGEVVIRNTALTFGKSILETSHEAWSIKKINYKFVYVYEIDELSYKKREEYQDEKRQTLF